VLIFSILAQQSYAPWLPANMEVGAMLDPRGWCRGYIETENSDILLHRIAAVMSRDVSLGQSEYDVSRVQTGQPNCRLLGVLDSFISHPIQFKNTASPRPAKLG
jgi:hypothetical protein